MTAAYDGELAARIAEWAMSEPLIVRAWGFGSRFGSRYRGEPRPDSDVDLALDIARTNDEPDLVWIDNAAWWRAELGASLSLRVTVWMATDHHVGQYLADCSVLIFDREDRQKC